MNARRLHRMVLLASAIAAIAAVAPPLVSAQVADRPLRVGDRILVKLWLDSVFADTARIQEQGRVILPRLGPLLVAGLPAGQIADSIRRAYATVLRVQTVEVTPLRRVTVMGEVRRPSVYFLEAQTTARDAIAMAGGITEIGKLGKITIVRDSTQTTVKDWQRRAGEDALIRSGEVIIVDRESWFKRNAFTLISGTSVLISLVITLQRL